MLFFDYEGVCIFWGVHFSPLPTYAVRLFWGAFNLNFLAPYVANYFLVLVFLCFFVVFELFVKKESVWVEGGVWPTM